MPLTAKGVHPPPGRAMAEPAHREHVAPARGSR
jgi:hypothetical protein